MVEKYLYINVKKALKIVDNKMVYMYNCIQAYKPTKKQEEKQCYINQIKQTY